MKVIDYTNLKESIQFDKETIMVMCYTPKIIVFEKSEELWKFKRVWEDIIEDYYERNGDELDPDYELQHIASWYVDHFEEEWYFMLQHEEGDKDATESRKLKVVPTQYNEDTYYTDDIVTYFGILNSGDIYTDMDTLQKQCDMIRLMFSTEELNKRLKDDTKEIFKTVLTVWEEDLEAHKNKSGYFEVEVEEE